MVAKLFLALAFVLAGCDRPDRLELPKPPPAPLTVCKGTLSEVSADLKKITMKCEDGKIVEYSTYKYSFNRKDITK